VVTLVYLVFIPLVFLLRNPKRAPGPADIARH
jgi:hypothetical protein